jgi:hypothetical protein
MNNKRYGKIFVCIFILVKERNLVSTFPVNDGIACRASD